MVHVFPANLALLHRYDVSGRKRPAVPVAVDLEDHGQIAASRPEEVAVRRVHGPVGVHGLRRGGEGLAEYLPAAGVVRWGSYGLEQVATDGTVRTDPEAEAWRPAVATAVVIQRIFFCASNLAASGTACALE